jgi:hypothetical protein
MSEQLRQSLAETHNRIPIPRAWLALALFGFGFVIPLSMWFGTDAIAKFWRLVIIFAAGLCFLAAGVIWGVHKNQTAELLRRKYRVTGGPPLFPELSRQLRGEKVTTTHRVFAINLAICVGLFGLALVVVSIIALVLGLCRHDLPV